MNWFSYLTGFLGALAIGCVIAAWWPQISHGLLGGTGPNRPANRAPVKPAPIMVTMRGSRSYESEIEQLRRRVRQLEGEKLI